MTSFHSFDIESDFDIVPESYADLCDSLNKADKGHHTGAELARLIEELPDFDPTWKPRSE